MAELRPDLETWIRHSVENGMPFDIVEDELAGLCDGEWELIEAVDHAADLAREAEAAQKNGNSPELPKSLVMGDHFVLDAAVDIEAVWGRGGCVVWASGEPTIVVGPQGVGKSTLAQRLVLARMGLVSEVLGMPVAPDPRRVLLIAADRPRQAQRSFRRMVDEEARPLLAERLRVWRGPIAPLTEKNPAALANLCHAVDAGTLVIDSLKDIAIELSREETGQRISLALQGVVEAGIEVLALHHQRKGQPGTGAPRVSPTSSGRPGSPLAPALCFCSGVSPAT